MLDVAALSSAEGYHGSAINRAYYAIFYAAMVCWQLNGLAAASIQA